MTLHQIVMPQPSAYLVFKDDRKDRSRLAEKRVKDHEDRLFPLPEIHAGVTGMEALSWRPRFMLPTTAAELAPFLFWFVDTLGPARAAVVGAGDGVVFLALCQALEQTGHGGRCDGIGFWKAIAADGDESSVPAALKDHVARHYSGIAGLRRLPDPEAAVSAIAAESLDLLFVELSDLPDGELRHSETWLRFLRPEGILMLHGATADRPDAPQGLAKRDATPDQARVDLPLGHGVTIVARNGVLPPSLAALRADGAKSGASGAFVRLLTRLGQGLAAEARLAATDRPHDDTSQEVEALRRDLDRTRHDLAEITRAYDARSAMIADHQSLRFDMEHMRAEVARLERELELSHGSHFRETALLAQMLDRSEATLQQTRESLAATEARRATAVTEAAGRVAMAEGREAAMRAERDSLRQRINDLMSSTSWRITAPLRRVRLRLSGK